MSTNPLKRAALSVIGASLLVATIGLAAPAAAAKPESSSATAYTEDDDTNDGGTPNNVADDGDNRHPSGKDRSVENGSGTQGRSQSDPDDDGRGPDRSNGGADKPNGPGGLDLADQDGNNGCGNDDDFEDDNEGWCGRKPHPQPARSAGRSEKTDAADDDECVGGAMAGDDCADKDDVDADKDDEDDVESRGATAEKDDDDEQGAAASDGDTCPAAGEASGDEGDASGEMASGCDDAVAGADTDTDAGQAASLLLGTEVLGIELTRGLAATAETPESAVNAQSAGGGPLAGLPLAGSLIEGELPMTGISTLSFLIVAMAAMAIGLLLVRATRRSKVGAAS